jgi:uncharacterized membrane protein YhhN
MTFAAPSFAASSTRSKVLAAIGVVAAVVYIVAGEQPNTYWLRMIVKPIPVLMMALWVSALRVRGPYQLAIMVGLLLSALGDILLEFSEATFLFGLVAFLLGHVAYIVAFLQDNRKLCPYRAAAVYAYGLAAFGFLYFTGNLGAMRIPVAIYVVIICVMLWRASCRVNSPGILPFSAWAGFAGALFFVVSDSVLAFRLFETPIQLGGAVVIITYWLGQLGITLSAWRK